MLLSTRPGIKWLLCILHKMICNSKKYTLERVETTIYIKMHNYVIEVAYVLEHYSYIVKTECIMNISRK